MTTTNGGGDPTVADARPVVLVRYRPGSTGEAIRTVHLVPLPVGGQEGAATALCGTLLRPSEMEVVTVGQGMPCGLCLVSQVADRPALPMVEPSQTAPSDAGPRAAAAVYQRWGWPVTVRRDQVRLNLEPDTVALIIPALLAAEVTEILTARRCLSPVLAHPYAPEHRVLLAREPYPVALPWPPGVARITTTLLLSPTLTPCGPLRWVHPPHDNSLKLCREIDVLAAVRTALKGSECEVRGDHDV